MTSFHSRHPVAARGLIGARQVIAFTASLCFVAAGAYFAWKFQSLPLALALMLLGALTANLGKRRNYTLLITTLSSLCLAAPYIVDATLPNAGQLLWVACVWIAVLFLIWDPERTSVTVGDLEHVLAQSSTGLLVADLDGRVTFANDAVYRLLNASVNDLEGMVVDELIGKDVWRQARDQTRETAQPFGFTIGIPTQHKVMTVKGHASLTRNRDGSPGRYTLQFNDQTNEQHAKHALELATNQLRRILAISTDIVFVVDGNLHVTYANSKALRVLDVSAAAINGRSLINFVATAEKETFVATLGKINQSGETHSTLKSTRFKTRQNLPMSIEVVRLHNTSSSGFALVCHPAEDHLNSLHKLKSSQARFSQVFHASPDAILILRALDSVIIDFNEGFSRLMGFHREDTIGKLETELPLWCSKVEREAVHRRLASEREVIAHEAMMRTRAGAIVHVEISMRFIEVDKTLCILCIGRDVTKRISAEAALIESEEKFEKIFTQSPDGIVIVRQSDGAISDLNDAFLSSSGYAKEELVGKSIFDLPIFDDQTELGGAANELAEHGLFANRSITFRTRQNSKVPALISGTLLELHGERFIMCLAKDMSKQHAIEERLRASEERFRGIFENAPIGIMLVDLAGKIFQANRCAAELVGYGEQDLNELHLSRLVPEQDRRYLKESLNQLNHDLSAPYRSERRMIRQNGLEIWTNFHIVLQRSSAGEPQYYIVQIADITDFKIGQQRMEQMAFYDTLTNLANRRLFHDRLIQSIERATRSDTPAALLYLDLDNFKRVNDTLGHEIGDHLLREVAGRLTQCVRKEDTVARPGGDEFTILLNEIGTPSDAGMVAEKILNHLREPITISGHPLVVTTSIGITLLPGDGLEPNVLTRNADLAMYKAKERGRNNYQFYSEDLNTNAVARLRTEYEIRQALERKEFELYYQPKVLIANQQIVGVESLVRWNHPQRGLLGPEEFIEVAEETGSIIDIGTWVIEEACRASGILNENRERPLQIAINISPRQFRDPNLVTTIRRSIRETQMNAEHIELEITETMLMQDVDAAEETVRRLTDLGVKLAIDDFGTGYSSLNYLKKFPINTVKVDKSFVMDIPHNQDDVAITRAVIAMAHQLKMEVVAEGVETAEQLAFLAEQKCEYAQGYLFSKPLAIDGIKQLLNENIRILRVR